MYAWLLVARSASYLEEKSLAAEAGDHEVSGGVSDLSGVVTPTYKHGNAPPHDIKTCSLLLDKVSAPAGK
ncbi:hypothetical protein MA16_Dca017115 [Dendrobium catenatum]|uniref:Uncharacterized protein n=1 Tax=Dendrobium catenatum TaxID=906689 RepID=A0A2I0WAW5_9ASPA|nr:hypothetical protein MA16_Dca017115 [Dendrobium catenatum]